MNNHFTVTIHDDRGIKQINLHKLIKKIALYAALFLMGLFIIGASMIVYLNHSVDQIEEKRAQMEHAFDVLSTRNEQLRTSIHQKEANLKAKKEELSVVNDRLSDIEDLIGLSPHEHTSLTERVDIAKLSSAQMAALLKFIPSGSPIEYHGITSRFGYRTHPTLKRREFHRGSDMKAKMNTPIYATANGVVEFAGPHKSSGYGRLIIIDHNYGFKTLFGHLHKVVVKSGTYIKKGDLIGYTGNSGMSNGPHLHYEVRFIQRPLNPFWFIKWTVANYNQIFEKEKKVPWLSLITTITADQNLPMTPPQLLPKALQLSAK